MHIAIVIIAYFVIAGLIIGFSVGNEMDADIAFYFGIIWPLSIVIFIGWLLGKAWRHDY